MKKTIFYFLAIFIIATACEKNEQAKKTDKTDKKSTEAVSNQAKGKVLFKTNSCEGFGVYIEVEDPKGIGGSGSFTSTYNRQKTWNFENAIGVPWFYKIGLPEELMEEGTWLHFEYRELDYSTADSTLFFYDGFCTMEKGPPSDVPYYYTITKIISSKSKK